MKTRLLLSLSLLAVVVVSRAAGVVLFDGNHPVTYFVEGRKAPVVDVALQMFRSDMEQVTGMKAELNKGGTIRICQLDRASSSVIKSLRKQGVPVDSVMGRHDAFFVGVTDAGGAADGHVFVVGSNGRGCAYGILEISRMAGVSPWVWWGDVVPAKRASLFFDPSDNTLQAPSVQYRGIFINDEDWSLRNWAWKHYEQSDRYGTMGPKTYKAVFQLLLRLRANAVWPAMHEGTKAFFAVPGNKEMADSCGIIIGSSHCEPLLRNNVDEWNHSVRGAYNYITNREQVQQYWTERLQQVKGSEELFTIGMRGIHDGSMEGVKTSQEKLDALQQVIDDQRELIRKHFRSDVENVPQVFIPYKEVLEIYESGLRVPDDVTLMWCDDNYGYMTRLSDAEQQKRSGGGGVYYHLSYWGRPHDYLWLTTTQPGLLYNEMRTAYDHNCRKLWIVNVHDPKAAAYDLELFLDMAWNINGLTPGPTAKGADGGRALTLEQHLERWLCTQFGDEVGRELLPVMKDFYRLCCIRKPEFMGWTQVELSDRKAYPRGRSHVVDTEFSESEFGNELERYLNDYRTIVGNVLRISQKVRPELRDAFFAHVQYPVEGAACMAIKMLEAQKARSRYQGQTGKGAEGREDYMLQAAARSVQAYRRIQQLTDYYNTELSGGKWHGIMNMMPRDLPVFFPPTLPYLPGADVSIAATMPGNGATEVVNDGTFIAFNASDCDASSQGCQTVQMLGHSMQAVAMPKDGELLFHFNSEREGDAVLYTAMIPTQPNDKGDLRYSVQLDNQEPVVISLKEKYRSEFWKISVLRGQALKQTPVKLSKGEHTLRVRALDEHVVIDQLMIDFKPARKFYVIPVKN